MENPRHEYYDPMSTSSLEDDYVPQWYALDEEGQIVPRAPETTTQDKVNTPTEASEFTDDKLVNDKLTKLRDEYHSTESGLGEYGHSLLG